MEEMTKDTKAVQDAPASGTEPKKKFSPPKSKKAKKWLKILIAVVVVAAIVAGCMAGAAKKANSQLGGSYLVAQAARQDLTLSVTGTATLMPADSYNVTTLISGEVVSAPFEEDDQVEKGDLLFTLDSSDAQNNVDRANISVSQAQLAYQQAKEGLNPTATISGTINELYVHNGDSVTAGSPIAKIVSSMDLSVDFLFPYAKSSDFYVGQPATVYAGNFDAPVSGTVESVSNSTSVTSNGLSNVLRAFTGAFGLNNRGREDLSVDADPSDPTKIRFVYTCDSYRQYLAYVAKLYQEGLIDPELFELSTAKMVAKGSQDMIFCLSYINCQAASVNADDYVGLEVALKGPNGDQQWNNMNKGVGLGAFAISPTCKDPATLVRWIDSFYTDEGAKMFYFGKEGEDFYYDENGLPAYNQEILDQVSAENPYDKVISAISPYASGTLPVLIKDEFFCGAECRGVNLETAKNLEPYVNQITWKFNFTTEESEELSPLTADLITNCHDVYRAKFIKGELDVNDDAAWQSYVDEMQSLGLERYIEIYQGALDRMQAQN